MMQITGVLLPGQVGTVGEPVIPWPEVQAARSLLTAWCPLQEIAGPAFRVSKGLSSYFEVCTEDSYETGQKIRLGGGRFGSGGIDERSGSAGAIRWRRLGRQWQWRRRKTWRAGWLAFG